MKLDPHPGVEITICVDGRPLAEHDCDDDNRGKNAPQGIKYIETVSGAYFTVHVHIYKEYLGGCELDSVGVQIVLDGKNAAYTLLQVRNHPALQRCYGHIPGAIRKEASSTILEKFAFSALQTNEGPLHDLQPADFRRLGEIEVQCKFVRVIGTPVPFTDKNNTGFKSPETLPEKCLKGRSISNQCSLVNPQRVHHEVMAQPVVHPYGQNPFATHIFKYRSRRDLQIEGIIPRSPSPEPEAERDVDDLSPEELREQLRKTRAEKANLVQESAVKIKKEKRDHSTFVEDEDDDDDEVTFTGESSKRSRLSTDSGVDVIDLTCDAD